MRLTGKVAVVTGGGNGIGAAIATRMAGEGAAVAVVDIDEFGGKRVAAELPDASFHRCDITDEDAVAALFADVLARHGRLDVLVNNAGVSGLNVPTHEFPLAEWDRVMAVNATAVSGLHLHQHAARLTGRGGHGGGRGARRVGQAAPAGHRRARRHRLLAPVRESVAPATFSAHDPGAQRGRRRRRRVTTCQWQAAARGSAAIRPCSRS